MNDRTLAERLLGKGRPVAPPHNNADGEAQSNANPPAANKIPPDPIPQSDLSVQLIALDHIDIERQIRSSFDEDHIADLALDFVHSGLLQPKQPVTLYLRDNGRYLLDAGENRLRAMHYAKAHWRELGVDGPTAFNAIRATVLGKEPGWLDRLQSQARENLLRNDLNDVDLARAVKHFLDSTPNASQTDAARWLGFHNLESGRVRVNTALKLLKCDDDLLEEVRQGRLASSRALLLQAERHQSVHSLNPSAKPKNVSLSINVDRLKLASEILLEVASHQGIDLATGQGELDRKRITALFGAPALGELLDRVKR